MNVKIINNSEFNNPKYATEGSAGMDLYSNEDKIIIPPHSRRIIKTGIFIQLPEGYEAQIRPRSGLAHRHGITVLNTPGTIDSDYTGEIGVILYNSTLTPYFVTKGERIAQMVVSKYEKIEWENVLILENTKRGNGGFGSTGNK